MPEKMTKSRHFGQRIQQLRRNGRHPDDGGLVSGEQFGLLLEASTGFQGFNKKEISRIENGHRRLHHDSDRNIIVGLLLVLHRCQALAQRVDADALLELGGYSALSDEEAASINSDWLAERTIDEHAEPAQQLQSSYVDNSTTINTNVNITAWPSPRSLQREFRRFFRFEQASDYALRSWHGKAIHCLGVTTTRMGEAKFHLLVLWPLLLLGAIALVQPMMQWPLPDMAQRIDAAVRFAAAGLLIPLGAMLLTEPEEAEIYRDAGRNGLLWRLKLAGAAVGFNVFLLIGFGLAMAWYYIAAGPLPSVGAWLLIAFALLWGHIVASRIPADRLRTFDGELKVHPADNLITAVYIFIIPIVAIYLFFAYAYVAQRWFGVLALLVLAGVGAWEARKERGEG